MAANVNPFFASRISQALERASTGALDEALAILKDCLEQAPDNADLRYEYGNLLFDAGRIEEAANCFRQQLALNPVDASALLMLGRALHRLKKPKEALHFFRQAQRLAPGLPVVHLMAGITALESHFWDEAKAAFNRVLAIEPANLSARLCLCMSRLEMFSGTAELENGRKAYEAALRELTQSVILDTQENIDRAFEAVGIMSTFFLPYQGRDDRELQELYGSWLCRIMAAKFPQYQKLYAQPPALGEKLRIGLVSGHLFNHSVWKIVARGWCKYLDHSKFMLFSYHTGDISDAATDDVRLFSDVLIKESSVGAMAEIISRHKPHLLIYPGLSMEPQSSRLAALRLAPVQCVSWGHPVTSGLPTMDYYISSDLMEPSDGEQHYTEKLVRLPNLSVCYEPLPLPGPLPPTKLPGINEGDITFLCCQNLMKYLPQYDDIFPAIACQVPTAKFIFLKFSQTHLDCFQGRLKEAFLRYGLEAEKHLVFYPLVNSLTYAVLNAEVTIYLDSIGWSGGNTTFESLPFDKPIVTLPGDFMRGRHTAAILTMMEVHETIASDKDDYVRIAVRLANDLEWRRMISQKIAANKCKVYGDQTPVRALERFMAQAVRAATANHFMRS
ncbi:Predicted O-linked N-acetylglucosamine transferase, SPINDLY family [Trichlorobacter thiogenes]|uniref:protein O-GlcNAc transferase n=1 Tax=Trichlorobacter thiogenes TaxID=115783 RepID=A0A1T4JWD0_9BACT|nr:tetratricopeptide repeat protein [Trichlorobacter thiogenes]SJZ34458.1 Predicted O-linked N-acetylglucosamine transferase, SPINDLY family [Trichlorobacter thiogenes]